MRLPSTQYTRPQLNVPTLGQASSRQRTTTGRGEASTPHEKDLFVNLTHIPATPDAGALVLAEMSAMQSEPPVLPADADLTALLPDTGGIPGTWVTAPQESPADAVSASG